MESIVDILIKGILFVGILGVWYVILKLLLRFPTRYEHSDNVKRWLGY